MEVYEYRGESMTIWKAHLIRENLVEKSKGMGLRLPQMQMLLAQERFLARLFSVDEGRFFVWKGGSLFIREYSILKVSRYTVDLDLLLRGTDYQNLQKILEKVCVQSLNDGFIFSKITSTPMEREAPYGGDRFEIQWTLFEKSQSETLKIDICTGDVVTPIAKNFSELIILPDDDLHLTANIYPAEFIFAEKLETVFRFGTGNTRCKDLIDLWTLIQIKMNKNDLVTAVKSCFKNRSQHFSIERLNEILSDDFFIKNMARIAEANFNQLNLPSVKSMAEEIFKFIEDFKDKI